MMKDTNCKLIYNDAGEIDFDAIIEQDLMEETKLALKKQNNNNDGVEALLSNKSILEYHNGLKKGDWNCVSLDKKEREAKEEDEQVINDEQEKVKVEKVSGINIKRKIDDIVETIKEFPELESEIINNPNKNLISLGQTDGINTYNTTNRWGKVVPVLKGNTRTASRIIQLKVHNFGSIADYDIDTLPHSIVKMKGQETYTLRNDYKQNENKETISRRFAGKVLSYWCYALGVRYNEHKQEKCGIEEWCDNDTHKGQPLISGDNLKEIIGDLIYLTRKNSPHKMYQHIASGKCSTHLYDMIRYRIDKERKRQLKAGGEFTTKEYLPYLFNQIKNRLYYDYSIGRFAWAYPKYSIKYLLGVRDILNSGGYYMDIAIPIVKELYKYPLKNSDVHIKPLSNEEHSQAKDDYDLVIYNTEWER